MISSVTINHQIKGVDIRSKSNPPSVSDLFVYEDYSPILRQYNVEYREEGNYFHVGKITEVQGWILHISVVWSQLHDLLYKVIPELMEHEVPFKIVKSNDIASRLLDGHFGYDKLGKAVTIYPRNNDLALKLAKKLISVTSGFRGPEIPTDFRLGNIIYTRYGSFNSIIYRDIKTGKLDQYIYDAGGRLTKDICSIPFKLQDGIEWPFTDITFPLVNSNKNFLKDAYRISSVLKEDARGRVIKSLRFNGLRIQWCIIKEGKHDMCADKNNRDIHDRIRWQYVIQKKLSNELLLPLPKVYDLFIENDNTYFVMEFIKGQSLSEKIGELYGRDNWLTIPLIKKIKLLDYLILLIDVIDKIHQHGYVHRDITPGNFILDKKERLFVIDMELAFSLSEGIPDPPFALGTEGFMPPEQFLSKIPTIKEDIYGLGASMVLIFTKLHPEKFNAENFFKLRDGLLFFISSHTIADLILQCLQTNPFDRPELSVVKDCIIRFKSELSTNTAYKNRGVVDWNKVDHTQLEQAITKGIVAIDSKIMRRAGEIWHSNSIQEQKKIENNEISIEYYDGLYAGVAGVMYLHAQIGKTKFCSEVTAIRYKEGLRHLETIFFPALPNTMPGLYTGAAGIALSLCLGVREHFIEVSDSLKTTIQKCLQLPNDEIDLAHGIAGQGIATLQCVSFLEEALAQSLLTQKIHTLLEIQQRDGAWLTSPGSNHLKATGLLNGVSGIVYFLLQYYDQYRDNKVLRSIDLALNWLRMQARKEKESYYWFTNNEQKSISIWMREGFSGVALCFIKAYEVLGEPVYKQLAEGALFSHPKYWLCGDFSQAEGLTGIGEIYLETFRVLKADEWYERAAWIVNVLLNSAHQNRDGSCHWVVTDNKPPTADFMVGNSGLVHFLLRYSMLDKFGFPFLSRSDV